jgi:hypothetical protein
MVFKQSTLGEILDSEREMVLRGAERYGHYYINAFEFINLLGSGMIKSIDTDRFVFAIFLSQIRKHLALSLFSALRLHKVQAMMNLRQVLEAGASAAYAIANTDPGDFADKRDDETLDPSKRLAKKRYDWLDQNFPDGSASIKLMKDVINELGTHANIVTAHQTFQHDLEAGIFKTPFFDHEDGIWVKTDLWQIANVALGIMDLFYGVNQKFGAIQLQDDWCDKFQALVNENDRLKTEMLAHERLQKFSQ